jgi:hypothetical protein
MPANLVKTILYIGAQMLKLSNSNFLFNVFLGFKIFVPASTYI